MKQLKNTTLALLLAGVGALAPMMAQAAWPTTEQVRIVVPYPPGTEPDILARDLGVHLNKATGKVFVIENRPGANAIIGTDNIAKAKGDGSALLMVDSLAVSTNPLLYKSLPYKWEKDLKPVTTVAGVNLYLLVKNDFPAKDYKEFVAAAKKANGDVNVGTGGRGHVTHLGMGLLGREEGLNFTYVPYKGMAPATNAILGGETDAMLVGGILASQHVNGGKVRVLAVGADKRTELLPNVPTVQEAGGHANSIPTTTFALFAPGTTPDETVKEIQEKVDAALRTPEMQTAFKTRGLAQFYTTPAQTLERVQNDSKTYSELIPTLGIQPE